MAGNVIDPGLSSLSRAAIVNSRMVRQTPEVISEQEIGRETIGCGECVFSQGVDVEQEQGESAAEYNRYADRERQYSGAYHARQEYGSIPSGVYDDIAKDDDKKRDAIQAVIAERAVCNGLVRRTIETTYVPFAYANAGRVKRFVMCRRGQDRATTTRVVTECGNPAVPSAVEAGVRFTAPHLRTYYS